MSRLVAELPVPTGIEPVRTGRRRRSGQERLAYTILLPALGTVFIIVTIPFVIAVWQSITTDDGTFIGLRNYSRALGNPLFFDALRATGLYALISSDSASPCLFIAPSSEPGCGRRSTSPRFCRWSSRRWRWAWWRA